MVWGQTQLETKALLPIQTISVKLILIGTFKTIYSIVGVLRLEYGVKV